jgi:hypothetical protein
MTQQTTPNSTWQPGSTAPRDGTTIRGKYANGEIELIMYFKVGWVLALEDHMGESINSPDEWQPL